MLNLKYLFIVEYKDGSVFQQTPEDVSISDPTRSCYYDVKQEEVLRFILVGADTVFTIDLSDGHFEVNNVPFFMHDAGEELKDFRLIFYRQHTHQFTMERKELSHDVVYCIGWQCNDKAGKNHKRVMEIA